MKRFSESLKWQDPWFRRLSAPAKLLWFYALDHCDNVGIVELDLEFVSRDCGLKVTDTHIAELGNRLEGIGELKYFIPKFIGFQYGKLSAACPAHKKVIQAIENHCITQDSLGYHYPNARVTVTLQDKKRTGKEEDKEGKAEKPEDDDFEQFWTTYPRKEAKAKALEAWNKNTPPIEEVLAALKWQTKKDDWIKEGGKYIPMPATYLNARRWTDERPKPKTTQPQLFSVMNDRMNPGGCL